MKFVILGFDGPDGEAKRKIYRPAHLAKMEPLDAQGRVVLAGPLTDKTGSLIVIEADSLEDAQRFARKTPIPYTVYLNGSTSTHLFKSFQRNGSPRPVAPFLALTPFAPLRLHCPFSHRAV